MAIENLRSFLKTQLNNASAHHIDYLCKKYENFAKIKNNLDKMVDFVIDNDLADGYFPYYIKLANKAELVSLFQNLSINDPQIDEKLEALSNYRKLVQNPDGSYYLSDFLLQKNPASNKHSLILHNDGRYSYLD